MSTGSAGRGGRSVAGTTKGAGKLAVAQSKGARGATGGKNLGPAGGQKSASSQANSGMLRKGGLKGPGMDGAGRV